MKTNHAETTEDFNQYVSTKKKEEQHKLHFLAGILGTRVFLKLSLCDKITTIAKLMKISQCDCGSSPAEMQRALLELSLKLRREELDQLGAAD